MYVFTERGLVAVAHYVPYMGDEEGWLDDPRRAELHDRAVVLNETVLIARGWHRDLVAEVIGSGQKPFTDMNADYVYRGLVTPSRLVEAMSKIINTIDYYSLKSTKTRQPHEYGILNKVHTAAKSGWDSRVKSNLGSRWDWAAHELW